MKTVFILSFILLLLSLKANAQQTIDKLNANQLKLPKESTNKALFLDGVGQVKSSSSISDTELGYLEGLSDTLVNLLSGKAADSTVVKLTGDQSIGGVKTFTGKLVAQSTINGSIPCPVMTEIQRDLFTPVEGDCVYNSDSLKLNVFDGSVWKDVGGAGGISLWLTANPYNVNDIVIESDKIYRCLIAHTSGVFATDLFAAKWGEVSASPVTPYSLANGGTNKALTAVNGGIVWVDADSFEILTAGVLGQVLQSNGAGAPSWVNKSILAKAENGSSVTAEELQVSNNQLTQVDTNKHLIESGNNNLLINPSFEHSTFSTGWTNSAGTFTQETVVEIHGKKAAKLVLSSQTMSLTQSSTLYQAQFADGVQGLASVRVKSDVALKVCSIQAGTVSTTNCVDVQANNKWGLYKVPFILGATSNGISIASTGAVTGTIYIDDAFVGAVDLKADIDSSKIAGESYFVGSSSCIWSRTSTSIGAFTSTAACLGPSIAYSSMGQWQTTDSDLPRQTINNLPAGVYKAKFKVFQYAGATNRSFLSINDGNTTCQPIQVNQQGPGVGQDVECTFTYTSAGNRVFELYGSSTSSSVNIANDQTNSSVKFILEYFGSGSVYSSTNADTDWASCGHTAASFTGFGSPTAIETQCKRQGGDLLMKGKFTSGVVTAVETRLSLPLWNGSQLLSAGVSLIPSLQISGFLGTSSVTTTPFTTLMEPSVSYITFGRGGNPAALGKSIGTQFTANGELLSFNARIPIEGWQNSNILIGQFNGLESCTDTYECTDTLSFSVSNTGVVSNENLDTVSGNCTVSDTSLFTCTYRSGLQGKNVNLSGPLNCAVSIDDANSTDSSMAKLINTSSSTQLVFRTGYGSTPPLITKSAYATKIICQKQGVDYIGKTAKAVASDQNISTPGTTKSTMCSAKISSTGVISDQKGGCFSSCTNATMPVCTFTSNYWVSGQVPNCWHDADFGASVGQAFTTSTTFSGNLYNSALTGVAGARTYFCHGERQ